MSELPHLRISAAQETDPYTYAGGGGDPHFQLPDRDKPAHGAKVRKELEWASDQAVRQRAANREQYPALTEWQPEGVVLTFHSDPNYELRIESLDRQGAGIELLSLNFEDGAQVAKVFVPEASLGAFLRLVNEYANSVLLTFEADEDKEQDLRNLADPDNGVRVFGRVLKADGKVRLPFLVLEGREAVFIGTVGSLATHLGTKRRNDKLVESIRSVRLALVRDFWQDRVAFPELDGEFWWEVWLRGTRANADAVYSRFRTLAAVVGIAKVSPRFVAFPERVVVHVFTSANRLAASIDLLTMIAELRRGKELAGHYVKVVPSYQAELIEEVRGRLTFPDAGDEVPCVAVLDGGVNRGHPLLELALAESDMHTVEEEWGTSDSFVNQHGTGMAGNALYGCLTELMTAAGPVAVTHRLESLKILPPPPAFNRPPDYGRVMQEGVIAAHIKHPNRNRALCMAVTADDRDMGLPTLWSGAVDDLCAGVVTGKQNLMFISTGNLRDEIYDPSYSYHEWNISRAGIEDPAQAWNAITVGAVTDKVMIEQEGYEGWQPVAERGDLCPTSRTSLPWPDDNQSGWPIKPDIVMEGGNYARSAGGISSNDDLSLLTTILHPTGRLFETTRDTSPATALAARYAAIIWKRYPKLWPETVRALLIHSATWNDRMRARIPGETKSAAHRRLRCYGYGVPDLKRAIHSAENAVTLTFEGQLQPYRKVKGSEPRTYEMHIHRLPWPIATLEELNTKLVKMRVTLSYFIEPSPSSVGWKVNNRYASHGLRFDVIRPTEGVEGFKRRVSRDFWDSPTKRPDNQAEETRNWVVGEQGRTHGSIHSDWWRGRAIDLARCGRIVVYPVTGWWKDRHHLERYDSKARYSLVVSLESEDVDVDLYTPISQLVDVETEIMT